MSIVDAVDEASDPWAIKVTRYKIKNIEPPQTIRDAMEKQMRAEKEKREKIALSEGDNQEAVEKSEGERINSTLLFFCLPSSVLCFLQLKSYFHFLLENTVCFTILLIS